MILVVRVNESCLGDMIGDKKLIIKPLLVILVITSLLFLIGSYAQATQTVPDPPRGLSAIPISPTSVSLSWFPPLNNGSSAITGYMIEYKTPPADYSILTTIGNFTKYNQTGLVTGKSYIYRVSAINSIGRGNPSPEVVATPTSTSVPPKNIKPNPPTGLVAASYSGTQINLSWITPANNGGPPITGYKIEYHIDSNNFTSLVSNTGTSDTTFSHTGLLTGHTYTYRVFGINSVGTGNSSNIASAVPTITNTVPSSPTNLVASASSTTSINLSWASPQNNGGLAIIGYKIEYAVGSGSYSVLVANTASTVTSYVHTGLTTGTTYNYRVSAINSIGIGNISNVASAIPTKTFTPTGITAVAVSPTQINLSWTPPSETYGQIIIGYKIDMKLSSNVYNPVVDNTGPTTSYSVTNLKTGKMYTFVVSALYSGGVESNPSPEASATPTATSAPPSSSTPPPQPLVLPGQPTGLNATIVSSSNVKLSWSPPSNIGQSAITGYKIEFRSGTGAWVILTANAGTGTSYVQTGLSLGTYTYRVSAINNAGIGSPSTEVSITLVSNSPIPPPSVESSGGILAVTNTVYSINYNIINGKILGISADKDTFSLQIKVESRGDGTLFLNLPRELIDAKNVDGSDDAFIVTAGQQLLKFNELKTVDMRTLTINFPAGTSVIFIYGTHVVPEFPLSVLVFVISLIPVIFVSRKFIKL